MGFVYMLFIATAFGLAVAFGGSALDSSQQNVEAAARARMPQAEQLAENTIETWIRGQIDAAGSADLDFGTPPEMTSTPVCESGTESTCNLLASATYAIEGGTAIAAGTEDAPNVQRNASVDESVITVSVITTIKSTTGFVLATYPERLTLRLTKIVGDEVNPVGAVVNTGAKTALADGTRAGCSASSTVACDGTNGAVAGTNYDTTIKPQTVCASANCYATPIPQSNIQQESIANGNVSGNGWRP